MIKYKNVYYRREKEEVKEGKLSENMGWQTVNYTQLDILWKKKYSWTWPKIFIRIKCIFPMPWCFRRKVSSIFHFSKEQAQWLEAMGVGGRSWLILLKFCIKVSTVWKDEWMHTWRVIIAAKTLHTWHVEEGISMLGEIAE